MIVVHAQLALLFLQATSYERAAQLVRQREFLPAIEALKKLAAGNPAELRVKNLLGIALAGAGRREESNARFLEAIRLNPRFAPAHKNLGVNQLEAGRNDEARKHFEIAAALTPNDPAVHLGLGHVEFGTRRYGAAIRHFERTGGLHLGDPLALVRYAASCIETGSPSKARDALDRLSPEPDPALQFEAGILNARLERYGEAARQFELARGAAHVDGYKNGFNLTFAYLKLERPGEAVRTAEELVARGYRTAEIYRLLAQGLERTGRTDAAYEAFRLATEAEPHDEAAYLELVALCVEHENNDLSLRISEIGVRMNPASFRLRLQRGVVMALLGRFTEAQADLEAAIGLRPSEPLPHVARALVLLRTDRAHEAASAMRKRIGQQPGDYLAHWLLAEAAASQVGGASAVEALAAARRSVRLNGKLPQSRSLLGKLLLKAGQPAAAVKEFEAACQLDPKSAALAYQLGVAYRRLGDAQRAEAVFANVRKMKAEDPEGSARRTFLQLLKN